MNRDPYGRFDDFGVPDHYGDKAFDRFLNRATHVVADLSFMNPVNTFLERLAVRAAVHRLAKMAITGKRTLSRERLLGLGLDEFKVNRILEEMRQNADYRRSLTGRRVTWFESGRMV